MELILRQMRASAYVDKFGFVEDQDLIKEGYYTHSSIMTIYMDSELCEYAET